MERRGGNRLLTASSAILAGAITLSGSVGLESAHSEVSLLIPSSHTLIIPDISTTEKYCPQPVVLFEDGLSGSRDGHLDRAFFQPITTTAESFNTPIHSVIAENLKDPEKKEALTKLRASLEQAADQNQQTILMGYSMGSRIMVEFLASLIDPSSEYYNPRLLDTVAAGIFVAGRNNNSSYASYHPELPNYGEHYRTGISPEILDMLKTRFQGSLFAFAEPDDDTVPMSQTRQLAEELGAEFILVDAPGSHFVSRESGVKIAEKLETVLTKSKASC